jgi:hypothetical protein
LKLALSFAYLVVGILLISKKKKKKKNKKKKGKDTLGANRFRNLNESNGEDLGTQTPTVAPEYTHL